MIKVKNVNNPNKLQSELKEINKTHVIEKNLHQIKNERLGDCTGEFQMVGKLSVGDQIREKYIRFRNLTDYEAYINAIDQEYESEDAIFNAYFFKINTSQFNLVNRRQYGNG